MLRLVDVTEDGEWVRRRVADELPAQLGPGLDALVDERLVVRDGESVDVVHEVVFRAWPQLKRGWRMRTPTSCSIVGCAPPRGRGTPTAPTTTSCAAFASPPPSNSSRCTPSFQLWSSSLSPPASLLQPVSTRGRGPTAT